MNYLYIASLICSIVIALSTSRIIAYKISKGKRSGLYLSLLLGLDTDESADMGSLVAVICFILLSANILLFLCDPVLQIVLLLVMLDLTLGRLLQVRDEIRKINKLVSLTKTRCDKHPEIIKAICMEEDGEIFLVCPKCNPKIAEDFGVTVGDCLENNNDMGESS